ncbi:MAG: methyltransferase domain-containing protein [Bryobacteraceae bacterium]|nr:methyltransferase domain-containing protein [Bryobacteraceae bacterium]
MSIMRDQWNERAREDAHYYVAFGRRDQSKEEFFATAADVLRDLRRELKRLPPADPRALRFLEIGCGPGRLMKPLASECGEIHGIDVSDEMIVRAKENLAGIAHAHAHVGTGATLDQFASESFDFVYSYAVFQHMPEREAVLSYLRETLRVLKPGAIARLQINGLPPTAKAFTTWEGVRFEALEIREFARQHNVQLLALEGAGTQYMWTTIRKREAGSPLQRVRVRRVTNAYSSEPVAPTSGRFSSIAIWVDGLGESVDLNTLPVRVNGREATPLYLGRPEYDGLRQLNVQLPPALETGVATVEVANGSGKVRIVPKPPAIPRWIAATDGVDLLSSVVRSGSAKLVVEELEGVFDVLVDGARTETETMTVDPIPPRVEINVPIAGGGRRTIEIIGQGRVRLRREMETA